MSDFKPLPKPVNMQKKPVRRPSERDGSKTPPPVKIVAPRVVDAPYRARGGSSVSAGYVPRRARPRKRSRAEEVQQHVGRALRFLRRRSNRLIGLGAAVVLALAIISMMLWSAAGNNAFSVYVDGEHFGYINFTQEMNEALLAEEALQRLQARENSQVLVNERINLVPANTAQRNILPFNEAVEQLAASFTFRIVGTAIELNGERVAVLRSQVEADELEWRLQQPFIRGNPESYHVVEFVEDFRFTNMAVDEDELSTIEAVLNRLDARETVLIDYVVQDGDTLGAIALRHNTTLAQIYEDNPGFSSTTILRVGDVLRIRSTRPFLSVRTVEEVTRTEAIPVVTEYRQNPGESADFSQVIPGWEGAEGEREVTVHITRVNGIVTEPERVVSTYVVREMEPRVVERGTQ